MSLNQNNKVPLPQRGIIKYKNKGTTYVYLITRIYRNEKGRPTNDRVSIGKIDKETGMLIPNKNYYEIYAPEEKATQPEIEIIKSCGVTYLEFCNQEEKKTATTIVFRVLAAFFVLNKCVA